MTFKIQPNAKIVFNSPYDDNHTYHIIKITNAKRLGVDPPCGVLDPKGSRFDGHLVRRVRPPRRTLSTTASPSSGRTHRKVPQVVPARWHGVP
uniref:MSP domain-containing protein n=1 Tax=Acrobeloides nanus TaxID=290746 RepID=A0A914DGY2_9BILA